MTKPERKLQAIKLRKSGYSYNLIAEKLKASKSTLSDWLSDIPYEPNEEVINRIGNARASAGRRKAEQKRQSIIKARSLAKNDIGKISKRDLLMLGIALYIGEGSKSGNFIRIINADPAIIRLAKRWFVEICEVPEEKLFVRLHLYPDNNPGECINYWSKQISLPATQFDKSIIDSRENKKMAKRGKLPHGTAHLSVKSKGNILHGAFLRRRIDAWMDIVLERD